MQQHLTHHEQLNSGPLHHWHLNQMNSISMNPGPIPGWMDSSTSLQGPLAPKHPPNEMVAKVVAEVAADHNM